MNGKGGPMRKNLWKGFLCLFLCISMAMGLFCEPLQKVFAVSQETQNEINRTEEEKSHLEQELEEQETEKENLEGQRETAQQRLDNLKAQYKSISSDLDALEEKKAEKEAEIAAKAAELEEAVALREKQYEGMKKRIRYMYETPQDSLFALLVQNQSIIEILNRVDNAVQIQKYDREQLEEISRNAEEIDRQKQELEAAKGELETIIEETETQQEKVFALQKQTSASINDYLKQIAAAEEEIGNTEAALAEKSRILRTLYAKAQAEEAEERRKQAEEAAKKLQEALANGTIKPGDSGIQYGDLNLTQMELDMLTAMIYCESRGEPYEGQLAVGYVIMNRVRSSKFPNTLEAVLRQNKQFEPAGSGRFDIVLTAYWGDIPGIIDVKAWQSCQNAALVCVNSESNVGESLFFRTHKPVPQLAENLEAAGVPYWIIDNHIFYYSWVNY